VLDVSVVVVTFNALPWLERALESVRGLDTVVVDNGSTDGTLDLVRERFPEASIVQQENLGLAAGWNRGLEATSAPYVLFLNADAWLHEGALETLAGYLDAHPDVAWVSPRLRYPDGRLQRSVRGFPTLWRLATEFLFLRKLAPRTRALNAFYAGDFDHDSEREAEWIMGACFLLRRAAVEQVGPADEDFFLFSEETDWCWRLRAAGWKIVFLPAAEATHVLGAAHGGRLFDELLASQLRFLTKHRGAGYAGRARRLLRLSLRLRGLLFPGERGRMYAEAARRL
jgi:N-acetylglucosaminyl-diphospho-decaprenol L-rhamnosyltransferase